MDRLKDDVRSQERIVVPEADRLETRVLQFLAAPVVVVDLIEVLAAVEFDDKALAHADEVDDVACDGVLAAELMTCHAGISEVTPELALCISHLVA